MSSRWLFVWITAATAAASACSLRNLDRLLTDAPNGGDAQVGSDATSSGDGGPLAPCATDELCAIDVATSDVHTCAVLRSGATKCWGGNAWGELGVPLIDESTTPRDVPVGETSLSVTVGSGVSCVRVASGGVKCWGNARYGILGANDPPGAKDDALPRPVVLEGGGTFTDVSALSAGRYHVFAISEGRLFGWGFAEREGNMAFIAPDIEVHGAREIATPRPVSLVAAGYAHGCLVSSGVVYGFGNAYEGQLAGLPPDGGTIVDGPMAATLLSGRSFEKLCASTSTYSCGVDTKGVLLCWGTSPEGGTGSVVDEPTEVLRDVLDVSCRGQTTCALTRARKVVCFGDGARGHLGRGTTLEPPVEEARRPTEVVGLDGVLRVSVGDAHACAVTEAGAVRCWGANGQGQLGDGSHEDRGTPTPVR